MATINLALNVQVVGGPKVLISKSKDVQAYDKIEVVLEPDGVPKSVEVQPGDAADVSFLLIQSSVYSATLLPLTYRVSDGSSDFPDSTSVPPKAPIALDEPHLYFGKGAVSALGVSPKIIRFTNSTTKQAAIEILVGRDAI